MTEVISVRFRGGCKTYFFDPQGLSIQMGDNVVVETAQGLEFATCTQGNHDVADSAIFRPLSPVIRMANIQDKRIVELNRKKESEAYDVCEKKIAQHKLDMKLVNISASFDGNKIIFFFTADGRVDFRELVRDLASVFRARIELRQIGVRDEAKMIGGLGICGRPFCCSSFLDGFVPVSIKMAKTQNLSLNPVKISGTCGRLMCCLKYEQNAYEDAARRMPKVESFVQTPDGTGNVRTVDLLREKVKVALDQTNEAPKLYYNSEVVVLRNGKGSREGIEIPKDRPIRHADEKEELAMLENAAVRPFYMNIDTESTPVVVSDVNKTRRRPQANRRRIEGVPSVVPQEDKKPTGEKRQGERRRPPSPDKKRAPNPNQRTDKKPPAPRSATDNPAPIQNRKPRPIKPHLPKSDKPSAPKPAPEGVNHVGGTSGEAKVQRRPRYRGPHKPKNPQGPKAE